MSGSGRPLLIIADIEGSSGCWSYRGSEFRTMEWARACAGMSRDIGAVVTALFDAGEKDVIVKDFHRTGYNILPELVDRRARIVHGYRRGPVPGIGDPGGADRLLMIGMHAASGSDGFLAHTLTSRIARLEVNGRLMCEAELFSSSVAPYGLRPLFLSGCPVACRQAEESIPGIRTCGIDKAGGPDTFDSEGWRKILASRAVESLGNGDTEPYLPAGPLRALVTMRDGEDGARTAARRWKFGQNGSTVTIDAVDIGALYRALIRMCYLTPVVEAVLPAGLALFNAMGYAGLRWSRRELKRNGGCL
jgi:D-amino peptidase